MSDVTQSLVSEVMKDLGPQLVEAAKAKLGEEMGQSLTWAVREEVQSFANQWVRDNVIPEVCAQLEAQKPQLVAQVLAGIHAAVRQLAVALEQAALGNLQSYNVRDIARKLFER